MLKKLANILSIVVIASVLSGCLATFPKAPEYRECVAARTNEGQKVYVCEWMNSKKGQAIYQRTENNVSNFLLLPLQDVPVIEGYEAEVKEWVGKNCK